MDNQFTGALKQVERMMNSSLFGYSQSALQQLDGLAISMGNVTITDCDYLKLMELYARKYKKADEDKALNFCIMRMQEILWFRQREEYQKEFPKIVFTENELDEYTQEFLEDYPSYLHTYEERFRKRAILLMMLVYVILLVICVWAFHWNFLKVFFIDLCLFFGIVFYAFRYGYKKILDEQFYDLRNYVDEVCEVFDQKVRSN